MVDWAERFDAQTFLHTADREWVMRKSPRIRFWEGTTLSLWDGLTLINCGGHFEGGAVLHWPAGANGKGALLTGDIIQVVRDRRYVSFMRSYPKATRGRATHSESPATRGRNRAGFESNFAPSAFGVRCVFASLS